MCDVTNTFVPRAWIESIVFNVVSIIASLMGNVDKINISSFGLDSLIPNFSAIRLQLVLKSSNFK